MQHIQYNDEIYNEMKEDSLWQEIKNKLPKTDDSIYHYTTMNGLYGILSTSSLQVSKNDFLNDSTEFKYFESILKKTIMNLKKKKKTSSSFCNLIKNSYNSYELFNNSSFFVLSCSKNKDNMLLWSNYANNIGCNLEFSNQYFISGETKHSFWISDVIYDEKMQKQYVLDLLESSYKLYEKYEYLKAKYSEEEYDKVFITKVIIILKVYSMFFKNNLFSMEEESRMVLVNGLDNALLCQKMNYKIKNDVLIPYISIDFTKNNIKSICIGPKNKSDIIKSGLELFLKDYSYNDVKIRKSNLPLRY